MKIKRDNGKSQRHKKSQWKFKITSWLRGLVLAGIAVTTTWNWNILKLFDPFSAGWNRVDSSSWPVHDYQRPKGITFLGRYSYWNCTPSHHACDGYRGILHIASGDFGGAGGTIFFQFVVGQLIYADQHNLLPFIHFDNFSHLIYDNEVHGGHGFRSTFQAIQGAQVESVRDPRMYHAIYPGLPKFPVEQPVSTFQLDGTGVWNHYFDPVSGFCPGDTSCTTKPLVKMERAQVSPGLHLYAPWAPKIWRYKVLPDHIGQPHIPLTEWLMPQRKAASAIVEKYYTFQPTITEQVNPEITRECLGLHVRWSDKGISRRKLGLSEFLPLVQAYVRAQEAANTRICIYVATDAQQVVKQVQSDWPTNIVSRLIFSKATVRSPNQTAVFDMDSHHLTNLEVLRDILELSKCGFLLHGNSAVSESAIYLYSDLIHQSVNLEDSQHPMKDPRNFERLVYNVSIGHIDSAYWNKRYRPPRNWWEPLSVESIIRACNTSQYNISVNLSPRWPDEFMPVNRWVTNVFIKFWQQVGAVGVVAVDTTWPTWFHRQHEGAPCVYKIAMLGTEQQEAISSLVSNPFFEKRFKSIVQEENSGKTIRQQTSRIFEALLQPQPHILEKADTIFNTSIDHSTCLGVHIPDPGYRRKDGKWTQQKFPQTLYESYIAAYIKAGGSCIFLATDSYSIWEAFSNMYANSTAVLYTQSEAVRNRFQVPAHYMEGSIQRLGSETLVDIWNLRRCGFLIHGYSPVSEVALFWNPLLKSIMMPDRKSLETFNDIVRGMFLG